MKKLFVAQGSEFFAVHTEDNIEVCRIYFDGNNGSLLNFNQARTYALLFSKSRKMLNDICGLYSVMESLRLMVPEPAINS